MGKELRAGPGAFVYTGSGKRQGANATACQRKCIKEACAIQKCLARNGSNERYCRETILSWERCCAIADGKMTPDDFPKLSKPSAAEEAARRTAAARAARKATKKGAKSTAPPSPPG